MTKTATDREFAIFYIADLTPLTQTITTTITATAKSRYATATQTPIFV